MECFSIMSNEIEGRIDPFYYKREFLELTRKLEKKKKNSKNIAELEIKIRKGIFNLQSRDYQNEGVPFIRISNIKEGNIDFDSMVYISEKKNEKEKLTQLNPNDLVFSKIGTIDRVGILPFGFESYNMSQNIIGMKLQKLNLKEIVPKYLQVFFLLNVGKIQLRRESTFQVQPKLTLDALRRIKIPLPPLPIQNKIVELMDKAYLEKKQKDTEAKKLFDSIDEFVLDELGIKIPELKNKMCFVVNSEDVEGKRIDSYYFQPKFEDVEKAIEKGKFEVAELGEVFSNLINGSYTPEYKKEGIPYIRVTDIQNGKIETKKILYVTEKFYNLNGTTRGGLNDIIFSRVGTIGRVAKIDLDKCVISDNLIKGELNEGINPDYLVSYFLTDFSQKILDKSARGAVQRRLNQETLETVKVPLPPLPIQNKIAEEVKKRMREAEKLKKQASEDLEKAKQKIEKIILGDIKCFL